MWLCNGLNYRISSLLLLRVRFHTRALVSNRKIPKSFYSTWITSLPPPSILSFFSPLPSRPLPSPLPHPILVPGSAQHRASCGSDGTTVPSNNEPLSVFVYKAADNRFIITPPRSGQTLLSSLVHRCLESSQLVRQVCGRQTGTGRGGASPAIPPHTITHFSQSGRGKTIRYNNWQMAEAGRALQMKCNVVTVWK